MRLVIFSDTHDRHLKMKPLPEGDVLIFCGDAQKTGYMECELYSLNKWLRAQAFRHKIVIAGNHDRTIECLGPEAAQKEFFTNAIYLQDSGVEIGGLKFWGSPWVPELGGWAFGLPRGNPIAEKRDLIPSDTDVLITHGPPMGILDECPPIRGPRRKANLEHAGCGSLVNAVRRVRPKVHCFGHIHECGGRTHEEDGTVFVNASICNGRYEPTNPPILVEI